MMNFLILGTEIPDYNHPILLKYTVTEEPTRPLTEDEKMIKTVKILLSNSYASDLEKLRLYYKEKLSRLQTLYQLHLSKYAVFNAPAGGLGAWIELNEEQNLSGVLPLLAKIEIYKSDANPQLDVKAPIVGIRVGFGSPTIETYEKAFEIIADHLKH